jgi:hypothetical protein
MLAHPCRAEGRPPIPVPLPSARHFPASAALGHFSWRRRFGGACSAIAVRDEPPFSPRHAAISGTADDALTHSCLGAGCDAWARPTAPAISRVGARAGLALRATGRQSARRAGTLGEWGSAALASCRPLHSSVCGRSACAMAPLLSRMTMCLFADSTVLARAVLAGLSAQDEGSLRPGKAGDAEIIKKVPFPQPQCWPCTKEMSDTRAWTCRESLYPAKHHVFDTTP